MFGTDETKIAPPADAIISPDTQRENRVPPGQSRTLKWPVLDAFGPPRINAADWKLSLFGLVNNPIDFTWANSGNVLESLLCN